MALLLASVLLSFIIAYYLFTQSKKPKNFPPGPPRIPFVGSIPFILKRSRPSERYTALFGLKKMVDVYGPIVGYYAGRKPAVLIADVAVMKEVLSKSETAHRPIMYPMNELRTGWQVTNGTDNQGQPPGFTFVGGRMWKEQREFAVRSLKRFGFGTSRTEAMMREEVAKLIADIEKNGGSPIILAHKFQLPVVNSLMILLLGKPLPLEDEMGLKVVILFDELSRKTVGALNSPVMSCLQRFAKWPVMRTVSGLSRIQEMLRHTQSLLDPLVDDHVENFDPDHIKDYTDCYIKEMKNTTDPMSSFHGDKGLAFAKNSLLEMFLAGAALTNYNLQWAILHLLHHHDAKRDIQAEVDKVCGDRDLPCLEDRDNMPLTNSYLLESFRLAGASGIGVPHRSVADVKVGPYVIPKGATVLAGLIYAMRDPKMFTDPHKFMPRRFIGPDGQFVKNPAVVPFGVGLRQCPATKFAESQFFLFFSSLMRKFDINTPIFDALPSYDLEINTSAGNGRIPPFFKCIFTSRKPRSNSCRTIGH